MPTIRPSFTIFCEMPFLKRAKKATTKKRTYFKRKSTKGMSSLIARGGTTTDTPQVSMRRAFLSKNKLLQPKKWIDLEYIDSGNISSLTLTPLTGTPSVFRLNSLFDPLLSGAGTNHQPYSFDQLSGLYRQYKVTAVTVELTFYGPSNGRMFGAAQFRSSQDTGPDCNGRNYYDIGERNGGWVSTISNAGNRVAIMRQRVNLWELEGLTFDQYIADDTYEALMSANPQKSPLLELAVGDFDSNASSSCIYTIKFIFHAYVFGTNTQSAS